MLYSFVNSNIAQSARVLAWFMEERPPIHCPALHVAFNNSISKKTGCAYFYFLMPPERFESCNRLVKASSVLLLIPAHWNTGRYDSAGVGGIHADCDTHC